MIDQPEEQGSGYGGKDEPPGPDPLQVLPSRNCPELPHETLGVVVLCLIASLLRQSRVSPAGFNRVEEDLMQRRMP